MMKKIKMDNQGVSEVVSALLVIMIVFGTITVVLAWGLPYIEEKKMSSQLQTALGNFDVMDDTIRNLIIDGPDTRAGGEIVSMNDKGSLSIDSNSTKMIIMYSFNESYNFTVSGLDDKDQYFTVNMDGSSPTVDSANIYWLDPGMPTWYFSPQTTPYKKIYNNHWCAQSFNNSYGWTLDKIQVYVKSYGIVTGDLVVSIYNASDFPGLNNEPFTSVSLPSSSILNSWGWINCDFENITLIQDEEYYIVLSTLGGDGNSNYYMWYFGGNIYTNGMAYINESTGLVSMPLYDFPYSTFYVECPPPFTPSVILPVFRYSGLKCLFNITGEDPDNKDLRYRIMWGDGTVDDWTEGLFTSGESVYFWHIFKKPGTYTVTVQAKNEDGAINEIDYVSPGIRVRPWEYFPEDASYQFLNVGINQEGTFDAVKELSGTLRMDIINSTCDVYFNQSNRFPNTYGTPFGRIWVFDLGSVTYTAPYNVGILETIFENGAVISIESSENNFVKKPSFFEGENALALRIIQVRGTGSTGGGGAGAYQLGINMKNSLSREPRFPSVYNLKIQIYGDNKDIWLEYFRNNYDFEPLDEDTLVYTHNGKKLIFDNSLIELNLEAIK
jgi:hypothetical protein